MDITELVKNAHENAVNKMRRISFAFFIVVIVSLLVKWSLE